MSHCAPGERPPFPSGWVRVLGLTLLYVLASGCGRATDPPATQAQQEPSHTDRVLSRVEQLYESAIEAGETASSDAIEWAREDIQKIGDWEYRVVTLPALSDSALEEKLNELGSERWETFWVERTGSSLRLLLKRPARSYLKSIRVSDLARILPGTDAEQ